MIIQRINAAWSLLRQEGKGWLEIGLVLLTIMGVVFAVLFLMGPVVGNVFSNITSNLSITPRENPIAGNVTDDYTSAVSPAVVANLPAAAGDETSGEVNETAIKAQPFNRLIIKTAELGLQVEDTDTVINRSLGIVTEYGGYVISSQSWFTGQQKYATLTIGVPSENFEEMLRRLKDLASEVTNETISGQDVTEQFVDLESRLRNLEATAARLRDFLEQAQNVREALEVNAQLAALEAETEQVKGQMAYLRDRTAFSTITLQISPQLPEPTPTPTPELWSARHTFNQASEVTRNLAVDLFQLSVDGLIWVVVVILPFGLPLIGLIWLARRLIWPGPRSTH
ncbi:MAG: DUF4349 domain-containing protein [Chloroflexota bacterium]